MNSFLGKIAEVIDSINEGAGKLVSWFALVLVLITFFAVVSKFGFNESAAWFEEFEGYFFSLLFLIGAAYTYKHNAHVRVDVFYTRFSEKTKAWVNIVGILIFLLPVCIVLLQVLWPYAIKSLDQGETTTESSFPLFIMKFAIVLGFALLLLQAVSELCKSLMTLIASPPPDPESA